MDNFVTRGGRPKRGPQTSLELRLAGHTLGIDFDREIRLPPKRARRSYRPSKETMSPRIHRNLIISYRDEQERECNFDISLQENLPPPNTLSLYIILSTSFPQSPFHFAKRAERKFASLSVPGTYIYLRPPLASTQSTRASPRTARLGYRHRRIARPSWNVYFLTSFQPAGGGPPPTDRPRRMERGQGWEEGGGGGS